MELPAFRERKNPCWTIRDCSRYVYHKCPAYRFAERPCWENAYTQNEILLGLRRDCQGCRVFNLYQESDSPGRISRIVRALLPESLQACGKGIPLSRGSASEVWISGSSLCYVKNASFNDYAFQIIDVRNPSRSLKEREEGSGLFPLDHSYVLLSERRL